MADKSPKKQAPIKKLTTKEKQDRKKAKKSGKALAANPTAIAPSGRR